MVGRIPDIEKASPGRIHRFRFRSLLLLTGECKVVKQQTTRPTVYCENKTLDNVFKFAYLGTLFAADGLQKYDIRARMTMAMTRCGKLGHMFDSPELGPWLKIRLYTAAVILL